MRVDKFLTLDEIQRVVLDLRSQRTVSGRWRLILFRLSCCCGMRRKEIAGLKVKDVLVDVPKPGIVVRRETTKGREGKRRERFIPLWWDRGTYDDIASWVSGMTPDAFVMGSVSRGSRGRRTHPGALARRWRTALRVLGPARVGQVSIHQGRHSFITHALNGGRSLMEVRDAAGHTNISVTEVYLHAIERDVPDLWSIQ